MNGGYQVVLRPRAQRDLKNLPSAVLPPIQAAMREMSQSPRNAKKLKAAKGIFSKRSGSYRILYEIDDERREVIVHRVGDRKDIYRGGA